MLIAECIHVFFSRGVLDLQGTRSHMTALEAEAVTLAAFMSGPDGRQRGMTHICHSLLIPWSPTGSTRALHQQHKSR